MHMMKENSQVHNKIYKYNQQKHNLFGYAFLFLYIKERYIR